jgi:hypothetical protein
LEIFESKDSILLRLAFSLSNKNTNQYQNGNEAVHSSLKLARLALACES